jgi:hypothetical protein
MKKLTSIIALITIVIAACNDTKPKETFTSTSEPSKVVVIGVYPKDGKKMIGDVLRITGDAIKIDSVKKTKSIVTDTAYFFMAIVPVLDPVSKKPLKTKNGLDSLESRWQSISKDSVNTHVENISVDTLLKQ